MAEKFYKKKILFVMLGLTALIITGAFLLHKQKTKDIMAEATPDEVVTMVPVRNNMSVLTEPIASYTYADYQKADQIYNTVMLSTEKTEFFRGKYDKLMKATDLIEYKYGYFAGIDGISQTAFMEGKTEMCDIEIDVKQFKADMELNEKMKTGVYDVIQRAGVKEGMNQKEALKKIYDWFVANKEYDYTYESTSAYDPIFGDKGICCAFSYAFCLIAGECGIDIYWVESSPLDHMWNMVVLGGKQYEIDVTWGICNQTDDFFMVSKEKMEEYHQGSWGTISSTFKLPDEATLKQMAETTVGGITYQISGKHAIVVDVDESVRKGVIKRSVKIQDKSYPVTGIGKGAFRGCNSLKTLTIQTKRIGTFKGKGLNKCMSLKKIKVPKPSLKKYKRLLKKARVTNVKIRSI